MPGAVHPIVSEGRFMFDADRNLIWRTERPVASTLVYARGTLRQIVDGRETLRLDERAAASVGRINDLIGGVLSGGLSGMTADPSGSGWRIELSDKDWPGLSASGVRRIVAQGGRHIETITLDRGEGGGEVLRFMDVVQVAGPLGEAERALISGTNR